MEISDSSIMQERLISSRQKLYGREHELQVLREAYESVCNNNNKQRQDTTNGTSHLVLVRGGSGAGKSSLIKEYLMQ